jgi:hypothetical protein
MMKVREGKLGGVTGKERLMIIVLSVGILVAFVVSAIVTFTLDKGRQRGPAFSLVHHYPEAIGFFILSLGMGMGFKHGNARTQR